MNNKENLHHLFGDRQQFSNSSTRWLESSTVSFAGIIIVIAIGTIRTNRI